MIHEEIHIGSLQKKIVVQIQEVPGASLFLSILNTCYIRYTIHNEIYEEDNHTEYIGYYGCCIAHTNLQ